MASRAICALLLENHHVASMTRCAVSPNSGAISRCLLGQRHYKKQRAGFATLADSEKGLPRKELEYSNILLKVEGQDAAVLDHYCQFVKSSGHVLGLKTTKQFNLPTEAYKQVLANLPDSYKKHRVQYEFKKYGRMMQIKLLPVEQADIWLEYIQQNIPSGVNVHIELKTWQDYVSPPDPRIEEQRRVEMLRKKGIFNKEKSE
ncbi:predicted protein [Nematostella vectensis]|uniref:Small ribosomal subunit protein uS10m n=2 Tax=Nematostella vectensis TaxID=45351 RepID=A7S4U9_NEMVE|nr:predicted protein [Nematostella vectensis]|eukprot:XP_001633277.1 predicted protein [Nematostella vectensis]